MVLATVIITALLAAGYTAYAGNRVYQSLETGRRQLVAAQASMNAAAHSADPRLLVAAAAQLQHAERDFDDANRRSRDDPALRLVGGVPAAGRQIDASAHLAAIGADMSRAGEGAAAGGIQGAALKQKYAGPHTGAGDHEAERQGAAQSAREHSASDRPADE